MVFRTLVSGFCIAFLAVSTSIAVAETQFDLVIQGGRVVDGTGSPWYVADVAIHDGKIVRIGRVPAEAAKKRIDATGLVVAPGFIDMMGQSATPMVESDKAAINLLTQGITTINAGEGGSAAPLSDEEARRAGYQTMAEYFALLESHGLPVNVVQTIGHTQVRRIVLGDVERRPSDAEMAEMQSLVEEAMRAGAIGVSTALIYPPAIYAQTKEIAALAEVAGKFGGRYYTHMRNEGDRLLEAVDEALAIGAEGNTPVHIFHLKAAGQQNWGKMQLAIAKIKAARTEGHQVTADIYPYVNNGLGIAALIHPRHFSAGREKLIERLSDQDLRAEIRREMESTEGWENWYRHAGRDWDRIVIGRSGNARYDEYDGESVAVIANACGEDPWDTFFNLVRSGAFALPQTMTDANKVLALQQEFVSFCTDVGPVGGSRSASHPRAFGAFPRLLSRYVRDLGAISLEQAVAQASATAANDVLAYDRGRISVGLAADVIVFDYQNLADHANFRDPHALSTGIEHVIVNGRLVLEDGKMTEARPGKVLRGPGFNPDLAAYRVATGDVSNSFAHYDTSMSEFMKRHRVPGASIAVTEGGRVVFARGYGYADLARRQRVDPDSLFRVASISKPITAVAILQLIEQGKLSLEDTVLDVLDWDEVITQLDSFDERCRDITIRHLLEHRGGWDRDKSFDAMFQSVRFAKQVGVSPPANPAVVIEAMLSQTLDFEPGQRYAYSNFGYCLLGRVIEALSDQSYESYVKKNVLLPIGVTEMRIGGTRLDARAENEVRYYHPNTGTSVFESDLNEKVPSPYGAWYLEAMDSHGGWIASATDLAKFAAAFDDPDNSPLLSAKSIGWMYRRPPGLAGHDSDGGEKDRYYSLGWSNRVVEVTEGGKVRQELNHWHSGSLPGTATIMIRRRDGKNFVALLNARTSPHAGHLGREIDRLLHKMADAVKEWPQ
ncbi:MAG: serine hydrolase [Rubripirellula sp.]